MEETDQQMKWWQLFGRSRPFAFIWAGTILSSFAGFYLMLHVSTLIFEATKSNMKSGGVFAVSWLLPVLLVPLTSRILKRFSSDRILVILMILQAAATVAILEFVYASQIVVYGLLALRGYFAGVELTARQVTLKRNLVRSSLAQGSSLVGTGNYLGMILGGLGSALGTQYLTGHEHLFVLLGSLAVTGVLYSLAGGTVREENSTSPNNHYFRDFATAFLEVRKQGLAPTVSRFFITVAAFQGYHNVARTAYSVNFLGLPNSFISQLQVLTTCAVVCGSLFVATFLSNQKKAAAFTSSLPLFFTAAFLLGTVATKITPLGLGFYALYIFFFEVSFMLFQNKIITETSHSTMTLVLSAVNATSVLFLGISVLILGVLTDRFGIQATNVALVVAVVGSSLLAEGADRYMPKASRENSQ